MEDLIISPMTVYTELIGSLTNEEALALIKAERDSHFNHYRKFKESKKHTAPFEFIMDTFKLVLAYDILIENFQKYLNHD